MWRVKMKKILKLRYITLILILMIFSLVACNSEIPAETTSEPPPVVTPDPTPEPTVEPELIDETPPPDDIILKSGRPFPFSFTAEDIYGNTVTEASLGEHELFFVHYWATWCGPCIAEMPDLAQLEKDYGDRVGFLVLLGDFDNKSGAIDIYNNHGFPDIENSITVCGTTFDDQHEIMKMMNIMYIPTTIIIDADGNMLEHLIGSQFENYAKYLDLHFQYYAD